MQLPQAFTPTATFATLAIHTIAKWYLREFYSIIPTRLYCWLCAPRIPIFVIDLPDDRSQPAIVHTRHEGRGIDLRPAESVHNLLDRLKLGRADRKFILRAPLDSFLIRHMIVPNEAIQSLPQILDAEIERKTPLKLSNILQGHLLTPMDRHGQKYRVTHYIISKERFKDICQFLSLDPNQVKCIQPIDSSNSGIRIPVSAQKQGLSPAVKVASACICMSLAMIALAILYSFWSIWRQEAVVNQDIASLSPAASQLAQTLQNMKSIQDQMGELVEQSKSYVPLSHMLTRLTSALPDDTWITELRLTENADGTSHVYIQGLSRSAAALVAQVSASPLFSNAALAGPIIPDTMKDRERFQLKFSIAQHGRAKTATRESSR